MAIERMTPELQLAIENLKERGASFAFVCLDDEPDDQQHELVDWLGWPLEHSCFDPVQAYGEKVCDRFRLNLRSSVSSKGKLFFSAGTSLRQLRTTEAPERLPSDCATDRCRDPFASRQGEGLASRG